MVSGLVTSPCDQLRIFSGEASEMRMASKSVMGLVSSNGLERYKTTLLGTWLRIDYSKACRLRSRGDSARHVLPGSDSLRTGLSFKKPGKNPGAKALKFCIAYGRLKSCPDTKPSFS